MSRYTDIFHLDRYPDPWLTRYINTSFCEGLDLLTRGQLTGPSLETLVTETITIRQTNRLMKMRQTTTKASSAKCPVFARKIHIKTIMLTIEHTHL